MFCSNCGSKLPDGANFCSVCGAKLEVIAVPIKTEQTVGLETPEEIIKPEVRPAAEGAHGFEMPVKQPVTEKREEPVRSRVSFDWSNVKDEPHKKEVPQIDSPWTSRGLEGQLFEEMTPSDSKSRTLNFIDILKQEKAQKARAAEEEAKALTERAAIASDFSEFEKAPTFDTSDSFKEPEPEFGNEHGMPEERRYSAAFEDVVIKDRDFEEPAYEEPEFDSSILDNPAYASDEEEYSFATAEFDDPFTPEEESFEKTVIEPDEGFASAPATPAEETPEYAAEPEIEEPAFEDTSDINLEAELAAILGEGRGRVARAEAREALEAAEHEAVAEEAAAAEPVVEEAPAIEPIAEEAVAAEPVVEEAPAVEPIAEEAVAAEPVVEEAPAVEPIAEEAVAAEPEADEFEGIDFGPAAEPATETVATIAQPADNESEIEALKRRLAELMGTAEPEPEEIAKAEEPDLDAILADEFLNGPIEAAAEPAPIVEEIAEESEIAGPAAEEIVAQVEGVEDALSIDELERSLFGEPSAEDVESEATKKIDKFYTLYKKNEEFQKLLDEEYNKLKTDDNGGIDLDALAAEPVAAPAAAAGVTTAPASAEIAAAAKPAPLEVPSEPAVSKKEARAAAKEAAKEAKKAAKAAKAANSLRNEIEDDEETESGGGFLTVIAIIIALLLVVLLAVILILNFAPDSSIAMKIDALIENITSYFTAVDVFKGRYLL